MIRVRANVATIGLRAGHEYELDEGYPGLRLMIDRGLVTDLTPKPRKRAATGSAFKPSPTDSGKLPGDDVRGEPSGDFTRGGSDA